MVDHLNLYLFSLINASAGLHGWSLLAALVAAKWLILLAPLGLAALWVGGEAPDRQAAVRAGLAAVGGLAVSGLIGMLWFHPRPFMAGVGHTFMQHAPDSSFPSDHATIMFSVALVLAFSRAPHARRIGTLLLPLSVVVAWSRVYLGVHYPLDMVGALLVAAGVAEFVNSRLAAPACGALVHAMETVYRRLFAAPIARGWLRP
jgi:undecaprenyl-diphosphatase